MTDLQKRLTDLQKSIIDLPKSVKDLPRSVKDLPKSMRNLRISNSLATLLLVPGVVTSMQLAYNCIALSEHPLSLKKDKAPLYFFSISCWYGCALLALKWVKNKTSIARLRLGVAGLLLVAISNILLIAFANNNYCVVISRHASGIALLIYSSTIKEDMVKIQNATGLRVWGLKIFTFVTSMALVLSILLSEVLVMLLNVIPIKCDAVAAFFSLTGLALVTLRLGDLRSCSNEIDEFIEDYAEKDQEQNLEEDKFHDRKVIVLLVLCAMPALIKGNWSGVKFLQ